MIFLAIVCVSTARTIYDGDKDDGRGWSRGGIGRAIVLLSCVGFVFVALMIVSPGAVQYAAQSNLVIRLAMFAKSGL